MMRDLSDAAGDGDGVRVRGRSVQQEDGHDAGGIERPDRSSSTSEESRTD